jgi:hypothetical protein
MTGGPAQEDTQQVMQGGLFDAVITLAEEKQTATAKLNNKFTVDRRNLPPSRKKVGAIQQGKNVGWTLSGTIK